MSFIYLDIETDNSGGYNGLNVFNSRIVTLQMLLPSGKILIRKDPVSLDNIKPVLENNVIVGHNLKFDSKFLKQHFGINLYRVYDTYIAEIILSGGVYASKENRVGLGLKDLVYRYCGQQISKNEQTGFEYGVPLTQAQKRYVKNDLRYLPEIYKKQQAKIKSLGLENTIGIEMKVLPAMVWLELSGIRVNIDKIRELKDKFTRVANEKQQFLLSELPASKDKILNLNSTVQLLSALRARGFELNSTNEDKLAKYSGDEIIDAIFEYRSARKFLTTYIAPAFDTVDSNNKLIHGYINPDNHRTYANFKQYGTETGRLSCSKNNIKKLPIQSLNLQNQPTEHEWRSVFCAEPGNKLIVADYNQIEPRIMAQEGSDSKMIGAYNSGVDLYKLTASNIFGIPVDKVKKDSREKVIAKQITLGLCYGMAAPGLIKKLKSESNIELKKNEAELYIHKFKQSCPQVTAFMYKVGKNAVKTKMVRNRAGRIRKFNSPTSSKELWGIERKAKNAVIQSLSADITKIAMGNLFLRLEPIGVKFVNTVHDELVFETSAEQAEYVASVVKEEMIKASSHYLTDLHCDVSITISKYWEK